VQATLGSADEADPLARRQVQAANTPSGAVQDAFRVAQAQELEV